MPAQPSWLLHIPKIRSMLAEVALPVVDRAVVERVFGLRRPQAIELMNRLGGYQAGKTLSIERVRLITELEKVEAGGECQRELARREKLTVAIAKLQSMRRAQEVRIEMSPDVFATRVHTLPEAIRIQPGRLEVEFSGCADLLGKLFSLAQAAANDYEGFQKATEWDRAAGHPPPPR